ncbi:MAG: nitroreductase family protein [Bacteroidales bacterium]|nr:nitroreductase family protein [Bacteroidales bacterium]
MTNDTTSLLCNHRSIRKFEQRDIAQPLLDEILTCGMRASNTGNMQVYSVIVTREEPLRSELLKLHFGQCNTAPVVLTVCADVNRYHHWCRQSGCDEPYSNLLWLLSATVDASLCAQNIAVAAESAGLGLCFLGTVLYNTEAIANLLHCPEGVMPVITMALGYPAEEGRMSERLGLDGTVHYETYHDYTDSDIERTHRVREEFPFNQEMVRQNGTRNLAEIFTKLRYPLADNLAISQSLQKFIDSRWNRHDA